MVTQTPQGSDWLKKALSPSHPTIKIKGVPDLYSGATAFIEHKVRYRLSIPAAIKDTATTWGFSLTHGANPIAPLCVLYTDQTGPAEGPLSLYNSLAGAGESAMLRIASWNARVERHRLVYGSVTLNLDAPATASQGSWMAANVPAEPEMRSVSGVITTAQAAQTVKSAGSSASLGALALESAQIVPLCAYYAEEDYVAAASRLRMQPGYGYGVMAPGAETGGCYVIQTLDPLGKFVGQRDRCAYLSKQGGVLDDANADGVYPYLTGVDEAGVLVGGITSPYQDSTGLHPGSMGPPLANLTSSQVLVEGLSPEATVIVDLIQGWEVVSVPNGPFMPFVNQSPLVDPVAIEAYQVIRRQLKDAYPAAYNDWDKLFSVIRKIASVVLPAIGMMGPVGSAVAAAGSALVGALPKKKTSQALITTKSTVVGSGSSPGTGGSGSSRRTRSTAGKR